MIALIQFCLFAPLDISLISHHFCPEKRAMHRITLIHFAPMQKPIPTAELACLSGILIWRGIAILVLLKSRQLTS